MKLWIGLILIISGVLSLVAEAYDIKLPTISWGFNLAHSIKDLYIPLDWIKWLLVRTGEITAAVVMVTGVLLVSSSLRSGPPNPVTVRKIQRFKAIKRGYYSFLFLLFLGGLAALDQVLVGKEALAVKYEDSWSFPAFSRDLEKNKDFGETSESIAELEPDYRKLQKTLKENGKGSVILPLWPYAPTGDTIDALAKKIDPAEENYNGLATRLRDLSQPAKPHLRYKYRKGLRQGEAQGWDAENNRVYKARYLDGKLVEGSEDFTGEGSLAEFLGQSEEQEYDVSYPPSEPNLSNLLGTTSQGSDVIAYLFGGLQVNFQAALIFIPVVYFIGVTVGLLMGFFGGWFDLTVQRIIEILSNIPFLFLVIIITMSVPPQYKDKLGFYFILAILAAFGWMGMTYLMRTSALKEKARDYVAASRVIGASTPRILFRHLLPNSVAILVTLIPFSISGVVLSLTALDYLGLGLPGQYATWGKLLKDGLDSLNSPWLVSSAFFCLVLMLVLVTFVGEAIREAFDPKKYTFYR